MSGAGTWFNDTQWIKASLLINVGTLASLLGMYMYWDIARWGGLIFTVTHAVSCLCFGIGVYTPAELFLGCLVSITIDAVVAISFLTPIAHDFTGEQRLPPTLAVDDENS